MLVIAQIPIKTGEKALGKYVFVFSSSARTERSRGAWVCMSWEFPFSFKVCGWHARCWQNYVSVTNWKQLNIYFLDLLWNVLDFSEIMVLIKKQVRILRFLSYRNFMFCLYLYLLLTPFKLGVEFLKIHHYGTPVPVSHVSNASFK